MFKVGKYEVYFKHFQDEWGILVDDSDTRYPETPYVGRTVCIVTLYVDDEQQFYTEGEAFCSMEDKYDKAKGRKISLARAIEGFDKELRTEFWNTYISTTRRL